MNEYQEQAKEFCNKYNVTIETTYTGHRKYFDDDKTPRACFEITITRKGAGKYTFNYGASLIDSYEARKGNFGDVYSSSKFGKMPPHFNYERWSLPVVAKQEAETRVIVGGKMQQWFVRQSIPKPTEYDILACLTKYDPGIFDDFCANYGYDTDSRKAEKIYFAVQKEWQGVNRLFSDCLEELAEIA